MTAIEFLRDSCTVAVLAGIYVAMHRLWRRQAVSCAERWAKSQRLWVADWSAAVFQMDRTRPSILFVATTADGDRMNVKLRLRVKLVGGYEVREVACCLPEGVAEDESFNRRA